MILKRKRAWAGMAAIAVTAAVAPLLSAPAAHAAGTLSGAATVKSAGGAANLSNGNSDTTFTLRLPAGAACPGDSPNDGYRWQTYMVPLSVNPSTLTFGANGPLPAAVGASFRQPLWTTTGSPVVDQQTPAADTPGGPGPILNIPDMSYAVYSPGDIPAGEYNVGIACTLGAAGPTQMKNFWNASLTFTTNAATGGTAQVLWAVGAKPAAPVLTGLTPGDQSLAAAFTHAASDPPTTLYTATATPTGGGAPVTGTGTLSPVTISGLVNGTSYNVTVRATNSVGDSPESNTLTGTPNAAARPPVTNLTATPGTGKVDLSWTAPSGPAPTGYRVDWSPVTGTGTQDVAGTTASVTGLNPGTLYTFTVTPLHAAPFVGTPASVQATPLSAQVLVQDITVTRPTGAIVLTQVCGAHGAIAAETASTGFPTGLPAVTAQPTGVAPTLTAGGTDADPKFSEYPYPENADGTPAPTYPTHCGVDLGVAKLVKSGSGAGQFFAASGVLNQVTVVDTRDTDTGWTATGTMSAFSAGAGKSFSGSQLGWAPVKTSDTPAFTDSDGNSYDQTVAAGPAVTPNTANASGLSTGRALGSAAALAGTAPTFTGGLGIAQLDARLKLLIPITAKSGNYTGTLTLTVT